MSRGMEVRDCKDKEDDTKRYEGSEHIIKRKWSKWRWWTSTQQKITPEKIKEEEKLTTRSGLKYMMVVL